MMQYNFPFQIDNTGKSARTTEENHIYQMIEQLIFTIQGERVNRPDLGTPINQMVFAPNSNEIAAATQFLIQGALQQWLGDVIIVGAVQVTSDESTLNVLVQYTIRSTGRQYQDQFSSVI